MMIQFNNPRTGQVKSVRLGWSWSLFLSGGFVGIPLFLQGLSIWGAMMATLWGLGFAISNDTVTFMLSVMGVVLSIFLGLKGNEMIAKNYLKYGWQFANSESEIVKVAKKQWGIESEPRL
jgi:hypothetical protein